MINWFKNLFKKRTPEHPPWIKATKEGKLSHDFTDKRWIAYMNDKSRYLRQWEMSDDGKIIKTKSYMDKYPDWKDYV